MKPRRIIKLALIGLAATLALGLTSQLPAQEKKEGEKPEAPAAPEARPKRDTAPFRGRVQEINKTEMTIKVGQRVFHMTSTTRITKAGKPATFDEIAVGNMVTGQYRKTPEGRLELISLKIVPAEGAGQGQGSQEKEKAE
ncbi:MAG: hypothetical protein NZ739_02785 [Verrucomicrobiae bacterium]|nr:hypothetical protein [Verrucomicrobiae bacterium]MCX7721677.1 hypothetical protein [Verrucomicrobiae bacterium]MDW7980965.1 hypothetical protein [Verrucomicrobiales bacterium]